MSNPTPFEADSQQSPSSIEAKPGSPGWGYRLTMGVFILAVASLCVLAGYRLNAAIGQSQNSQKIVVLDTQAIIAASTKQIMENKSLSIEQVGEIGRKLAENLKKVVISYRDSGYIVLNGSALVVWPESADVTKPVAEQLGVKL